MTRTIISKVNGVTFEGRQENLKKVNPGDPVKIVPELRIEMELPV